MQPWQYPRQYRGVVQDDVGALHSGQALAALSRLRSEDGYASMCAALNPKP